MATRGIGITGRVNIEENVCKNIELEEFKKLLRDELEALEKDIIAYWKKHYQK